MDVPPGRNGKGKTGAGHINGRAPAPSLEKKMKEEPKEPATRLINNDPAWMQALFARARKFTAKRRERKCAKSIKYIVKHNPDMLREYIIGHAKDLSKKLVMHTLDNERIMHCYECPSRFQLRRSGGLYLCQQHYNVQRKEAGAVTA